MRTRLKALALFFVRVALLYALLIAAWPAVRGLYSATFRAACQVLPEQVGAEGRVTLLDTAAGPLDVSFLLTGNDGRTARRRISSYFVGYLPSAFLISLVLSTPISWKRRGRALMAALLLLHAFIALKVVVSVYSPFATHGGVRLVDLGRFTRTLLLYVNTLLNESTITIFSVPVVIWFLVSFRRDDRSFVSDRTPRKQASRFGTALAVGLLLVIGVLGLLAVSQSRRWQDTVWWTAVGAEPLTPGEHADRAAALFAQGKLEDSIQEARESLRLDPLFAPAHHRLGIALVRLGKLDEAARSLEEAVRLSPEFAEAHHWLGTTLGKQSDHAGSVEHLTRAVELRPGDHRTQSDLAVSLAAMGRWDQAARHLEAALRLEPGSAFAHYMMGQVLQRQGRTDRALHHYREAVRLGTSTPGAEGIATRAQGRIDRILPSGG